MPSARFGQRLTPQSPDSCRISHLVPACAPQLCLHELSVGCCSFMCRAYLTGTFVSFVSGRRVLIMEKRFLDVHFDYVVRFHVQIAGR